MAKVRQKEEETVRIKFFSIRTDKAEQFIDELEDLCRKYCLGNEFFFKHSVEG